MEWQEQDRQVRFQQVEEKWRPLDPDGAQMQTRALGGFDRRRVRGVYFA